MECTNGAVCTLTPGEMTGRLDAWRRVAQRALSRRSEGTLVTSVYPSEPQLIQELRNLIAAEADCCSFFSFTVSEGADRTVVELKFPEEARSLVELVVPAPDDRA